MLLHRFDGKCSRPSSTVIQADNCVDPFLHPRRPRSSGCQRRKPILRRNSRSSVVTHSSTQQAEVSRPGTGTEGQQGPLGSSEDSYGGQKVVTTFRWPAALAPLDGKEVSVVGSFTGWNTAITLRKSPETADHVRSIALPPGKYQYKYKVEDRWCTSPCEATTSDGQGQFNNQRTVASSASFSWRADKWGGKDVFITGDFTAWTELIPLKREGAAFTLECSLPAGTYSYQFLVDGSWMTSPDAPVAADEKGHLCNQIVVRAPPAFHVFYATGWEQPVVHARQLAADGEAITRWQETPMSRSESRGTPNGGAWFTAVVPARGAEHADRLEFYVANGQNQADVDKPLGGGHYICPSPGGYKLLAGRLTPFSRACHPPTMLVSDLDGTMVSEGEEADAATRDFCNYWESTPALAGGVLVYNTGRSLGQFVSLLQEKQGALALPDVLITAVGTKIFMLDREAGGRGGAPVDAWKEDLQWAARLDYAWDLEKVKQVAGGLVNHLKVEGAGDWLDHGTEHPHRIALSIRADKVQHVVYKLGEGFASTGLQVRVIVSGVGGWRYVDCVSIKGGKFEALEYVRTLFGVPRERCMAAGDSGNDILMLEGKNKAIVVGNAQPELVDWLLRQAQDERIVYTDAHIASGILEGMARHGLY